MKNSEIIKNTSPATIAKIRGTRRETSSRDKALLVKKALEIEELVERIGELCLTSKKG